MIFLLKAYLYRFLHRMLILLGTKEFNVQPLLVGQDKIIDIKGDNINAEWVLMTPMENEIKLIPDYTNEKLLITQTSELGSYHVFADGNLFLHSQQSCLHMNFLLSELKAKS